MLAKPIKRFRVGCLLGLLLLTISLSATPGDAGARTEPFKITSMKAMLFYDNKGTFSRDVSEAEGLPYLVPSILWNTPLEGSAREGASTSVLVTVEVNGEWVDTPSRKLEFTARYRPLSGGRRQIVMRRIVPIRIREQGNYITGFWLDNAGCYPVSLQARIIGQREPAVMKRVIRFGCGE